MPGQSNYSAPTTSNAYMYEQAEEANVPSQAAAAATTPKPRKFFKSRTAAAAASSTTQDAPASQHQPQQPVEEVAPVTPVAPVKVKQSKKQKAEFYVQTPMPVESVPVIEPAVAAPPPPPSETIPSKRYLARARKQVNYNEDENSLPPAPAPPPPPPPAPQVPIQTVPISAVSPSLEHPPIKLRISKVYPFVFPMRFHFIVLFHPRILRNIHFGG